MDGAGDGQVPRVRPWYHRRWRHRQLPAAAAKPLVHAARIALHWGLAGLLLGMIIGGAAGLWFASIVNALYGIGGDNYSGPLFLTTEQAAWVYLRGLSLGFAFVGGPLAVVSGLMGFVCGLVEAKSARSVKPEPAPDTPRE